MELQQPSKSAGDAHNLMEMLERLRLEYSVTLPAKIIEVEAAASRFG